MSGPMSSRAVDPSLQPIEKGSSIASLDERDGRTAAILFRFLRRSRDAAGQVTLKRFLIHSRGSVSATFAALLIPLSLFAGVAIDFGRALEAATTLQAGLDAATLNGASLPMSQRDAVAAPMLMASLAGREYQNSLSSSFSSTNTQYQGVATITLPMTFLKIARLDSISITRSATAKIAVQETACIQSYGIGQPVSTTSLTLNGTPSLNLAGCNMQSNTSVKCNGNNNGFVAATKAVGTVTSCNNPTSGVSSIPDIYANLAQNISLQCSSWPSVTWSPGGSFAVPGIIAVSKSSFIEYHVCGDFTLSGIGGLTGSSPTSDSVFVIENGSLTLAAGADISATRATIVLSGTQSPTITHTVNFPNGNGNGAKLVITPSLDDDNPWSGVSIYLDPRLSTSTSLSWSSGATLLADGLIYFGRADMTLSGNVAGAGGGCTKLAVNSITLSGNISLSQADSACAASKMKRYASDLYLSQ